MVTSSYFMNLPIELKRELRLFAIDHDTTMSEIIVLSLKSYFRENQYSSEELAKNGEELAKNDIFNNDKEDI